MDAGAQGSYQTVVRSSGSPASRFDSCRGSAAAAELVLGWGCPIALTWWGSL